MVLGVLESNYLNDGDVTTEFERRMAMALGARHAVAVTSGTTAIFLSLAALGVQHGDEVVVPDVTFIATANAVEEVGARPILVDSEPGTGLIDLDAAEAAITPRTRAIMPVHLAGRPVDLDAVGALRDRHGLTVIEDAAHAMGTCWGGRAIGTHGNLAAFSFYATKNVTTAEGGALATDNPCIAREVERLALHGLSLGAWQRYGDAGFRHFEVASPGIKANMTDLSASIGLHQLPRLEGWTARRVELAARYDALLAGLPVQTPPPPDPRGRHSWHLYSVLLEDEAGMSRDAVLDGLLTRRIGTGVHYRGVHLHPYYASSYGIEPGMLPVASDISERTLSLPLSPAMTDADQDDVVEALDHVLASGPALVS